MTTYFNPTLNENVRWHAHLITRQNREVLHKHRGAAIWFTGLSGSGKSTLASSLEKALYQQGISTYLLDGDNIRHGLCRDLGFSDAERRENVRRVGEVVRLMVDAALIVLTAFISPHRAEREIVRNMVVPTGRFIEVFVDTPLATCKARDPKGLYQRAYAGKLHNFTGIDAVYEAPKKPELHLDGQKLVKNLTDELLKALSERSIIYF